MLKNLRNNLDKLDDARQKLLLISVAVLGEDGGSQEDIAAVYSLIIELVAEILVTNEREYTNS